MQVFTIHSINNCTQNLAMASAVIFLFLFIFLNPLFDFFQFVHQSMDCYRYVQVVLEQVPYYQLFLTL